MVSVLAMAANTRAVFRSQVMDLDAALNEYEATVYAGVSYDAIQFKQRIVCSIKCLYV